MAVGEYAVEYAESIHHQVDLPIRLFEPDIVFDELVRYMSGDPYPQDFVADFKRPDMNE